MAKIKVRYKGIADERIIRAKDLDAAGIEGAEKDLVWNRGNLFALEVDASDKLEELLRAEGHFSISKVNDEGSEQGLSEATDTKSEGDVLVDGTTGATTRAKSK